MRKISKQNNSSNDNKDDADKAEEKPDKRTKICLTKSEDIPTEYNT